MNLQHLRFFVALARERHFAAAAEACGVTQPTLSAGLRALEQELGKRLVERDRRFIGLTPDGLAVLPWAQQALGSLRGLAQAAGALSAPVQGEFRLAAIPAALPLIGPLGEALLAHSPGLTLAVHTATAREIERGLASNAFDAGVTYLDDEPAANMLVVPLHAESHLFVARRGSGFDGLDAIDWAAVAAQRLCLLHQGMQFRRILDRQFAARGLAVSPAVVADSYVSLLALVRTGGFVTVIPDAYADLVSGLDWGIVIPFADPAPDRRLGLMVVNRDPLGPMARAGIEAAQGLA